MKPFKIPAQRSKPDEVDRATSGVRSAMSKLANLMCNDDLHVVLKVAHALRQMGSFAGGPLARAISRASDPRHRVLMLSLLREIGSFADPDVFNVLKRMARNDPEPILAGMAEEILMHLLNRETSAELMGSGRAGHVVRTAPQQGA